jgi:hypothetical protein
MEKLSYSERKARAAQINSQASRGAVEFGPNSLLVHRESKSPSAKRLAAWQDQRAGASGRYADGKGAPAIEIRVAPRTKPRTNPTRAGKPKLPLAYYLNQVEAMRKNSPKGAKRRSKGPGNKPTPKQPAVDPTVGRSRAAQGPTPACPIGWFG